MTLLVFGQTGQVARELQRLAPDATFLGRAEADLSDPEACAAAIVAQAPHAVINAAAYTAVDRAEDEEELATRINGAAPGAMARACAGLGIPLVHISTDYVFDGAGDAPRRETDPVQPQNAYGRSKLAGERAVTEAGGPHGILRTSWVFSAHGNNFVKTMLRLSETRDALSIVEDQIGGPTPAADIAAACLDMAAQLSADPAKSGIYHFSGAPDVSWKDFAEAIFALAGRKVAVSGIPTKDYPTPAIRPLNSRLDCGATRTAFGIGRPDWRTALKTVLAQLGETGAEMKT
ncbi:dTDP-4-dehydrorhamnose reductase [Marimonas lutisalis]|uniref:dTDP-4-dehydrorhamnose reductase n=1 Tax=Marimonas lutisalis TaxID=2545756 RepID=UPI0010F748A8|nr:dTDP-4-dehydrorhamnose reductase [Marimonas lutisalis]